MKLPQRWLEVLIRIQSEFPEAVIAGGALRDLLTEKPVKDVDIFVKARGDETRELLESALGCKCEPLQDPASNEYAEYFGELNSVYNVIECPPCDCGTDEFFCLHDAEPPIQIIALNTDVTLHSAVERFDFGICKVATNGCEDLIHPEFVHDLTERCFTFRAINRSEEQIDRSRLRHERLQEKFQGWPLVFPDAFDVVI